MAKKHLTSKLIKLIATLFICLLLIFLNPLGIINPIRGFFWTLARPFQKTFYILSAKGADTLDFLKSIGDLRAQNEQLIKENNDLAGQIAQLKDEKRENDELRQQLNLIPRGQYDLEASFVIGQDPQKLGSWIMIDKGLDHGIQKDMPVIVSNSILIGRISEVYPTSAKVDLLTSSSSSINAVDTATSARGVAEGEYGLGIVLNMVSQTDTLNQGDGVVTSGLGGNLPKGLLLGNIQEIGVTPDKLFQQALVAPQIRYSQLDIVFVIKK